MKYWFSSVHVLFIFTIMAGDSTADEKVFIELINAYSSGKLPQTLSFWCTDILSQNPYFHFLNYFLMSNLNISLSESNGLSFASVSNVSSNNDGRFSSFSMIFFLTQINVIITIQLRFFFSKYNPISDWLIFKYSRGIP